MTILLLLLLLLLLLQSKHKLNLTRAYQLIPVNDTKLLSVLSRMPLELDQLGILCDMMAMEESANILNRTHHNISAVIREEVWLTETSNVFYLLSHTKSMFWVHACMTSLYYTIINWHLSLQLFPNEEPTIVKKLCLTHRLSEYFFVTGHTEIYLTGRFLNLFNEVQTKLYHTAPINRNP